MLLICIAAPNWWLLNSHAHSITSKKLAKLNSNGSEPVEIIIILVITCLIYKKLSIFLVFHGVFWSLVAIHSQGGLILRNRKIWAVQKLGKSRCSQANCDGSSDIDSANKRREEAKRFKVVERKSQIGLAPHFSNNMNRIILSAWLHEIFCFLLCERSEIVRMVRN